MTGVTDQSYAVHLTLSKSNGDITLDFRQTDDQAKGAVNFIMHESVPKFMYSLYLTADDPSVLINHGFVGHTYRGAGLTLRACSQ